MKRIQAFDPSTATSGTIDTKGINPGEQLMLYNDSPIGMQLVFADGSIDAIPPGWNKDFVIDTVPMGIVKWTFDYQLVATGYPSSKVTGTIYEPGEHVAHANASMQRGFTLTGGAINVGSAVGNIQNDGNPSGTFIIEVTVSGQSSSSIILKSDGTLTIAEIIAGVITPFLQSFPGATTILKIGETDKTVEIPGNVLIDQSLQVTGPSSFDNIKIVTDGNGGLHSNMAQPWFILDGVQPLIQHSVGNGTRFQEGLGANGVVVGRLATQSSCIIANLNNGGGIGFKTNGLGGGRLAQFKSTGDMTINNRTYFTVNASPALTGSGVYDGGFDYAENFPVDKTYDDFSVVCMNDYGQFTRCTHDKCQFASIVSLKPAFCAGGGYYDEDEPPQELSQPIALVGRLKVKVDKPCGKNRYVTSDGNGGLRCMNKDGEPGMSLGYTLCDSVDNEVFIMIRPVFIPYMHD